MTLQLGIIGYGWVARDYMLPAVQDHPGVYLAAVVSPNPDDFRGLPSEVQTFSSASDMLRATVLDAVYVASPNHLHREHVELALDAGLHVLCEKPLAAGIEDARAIIAAAEEHDDLVYRTAYDQRHHPAHRVIRKMIREEKLGRVTQVRIDYACWLPADWAENNWRIDPARAGGGAVIDLAPHGLDLSEYLTGQRLEAVSVYLQHGTQKYDVDDGGAIVGRLDGGALLVHTVGYNRPESLPRRRLELIGTGGMLLAENTMGQTAGGTLTYTPAQDEATRGGAELATAVPIPFATVPPFHSQLQAFVAAIHRYEVGPAAAISDLRLAELLDAQLNKAALV